VGKELVAVVEFVRGRARGSALFELSRLNLLVGRALSCNAATIPDDPELVQRAWSCAREIVGHEKGHGRDMGGEGAPMKAPTPPASRRA
jgi:hypothetical protein